MSQSEEVDKIIAGLGEFDLREGEEIDEKAFKELLRAAANRNASKSSK